MFSKPINYNYLGDLSKNFEDLYKKLQASDVRKSNNFRKNSLILFFLAILSVFGFIFIPVAFIRIMLFVLFFVFLFVGLYLKRQFRIKYKSEIIATFVKAYNKDLTYTPEKFEGNEMSSNFKIASFNTPAYDYINVEDYIKGYLDKNTFFRMAEITLIRETRDLETKSTYRTKVFTGLFAFTASVKEINSFIKISLDDSNFKRHRKNVSIDMDSSEFEEYFDVFSTDKILTMRILTHDVMDALVNFYKSSNVPFEIVIKNKCIYLRFFTGPMFEPKLFHNVLDKAQLYKNYCILNFVLTISQTINKVLEDIEV